MAGSLSILKIPSSILTNADYNYAICINSFFLNNSSPGSNITYFLSCVSALMQTYSPLKLNSTLIVNTCGWVDGLGASMLIEATKLIKPHSVVTMMKHA